MDLLGYVKHALCNILFPSFLQTVDLSAFMASVFHLRKEGKEPAVGREQGQVREEEKNTWIKML